MTEQISAKGADFLAARRLDIEAAVRLGIETAHTASGDALVLPFIRKGRVVRRKFRGLDEKKFWQDKGGVRCAWNEDVLRDDSLIDQPVIITEGELDCVAALQAGFPRVISVPDGAPPPGERDEHDLREGDKYAWLLELEREGLLSKDRVPAGFILAVDGDENGAALQHDLTLLLHMSDPVRRARYDASGEIDDRPEDAPEARAMMLVAKILDEVMAGEIDPTSINLVTYVENRIGDERKKVEYQMVPLRLAVARAKRVEAKFKRKSKGDNVLSRLVAAQRRERERVLEASGQLLKVFDAALVLVRDYTFDADPQRSTATVSGVDALADYLRGDIADAIRTHQRRGGR